MRIKNYNYYKLIITTRRIGYGRPILIMVITRVITVIKASTAIKNDQGMNYQT